MTTAPDTASWDEPIAAETSDALWEGDEGTLSREQRTALVVLLKNRLITSRDHPTEWRTIAEDPAPIRSRLHDLFLDLVMDTTREVAYKQQAVSPPTGRPFVTLLYDVAWNREETILMVHLRAKLRAEQASGSTRAHVDRADLLEAVAAHRPATASDRSGDHKRAQAAIKQLNSAGLLLGNSEADRFEISPAIEVLLPVEKLLMLRDWLHTQNQGPAEHDTAAVAPAAPDQDGEVAQP